MYEVCDLYASCNKMLRYAPKEFAKYSQFVLCDRTVSIMASTFHVKCVIFVNHVLCMLYVRANKCMRLGVRVCVRACVRACVFSVITLLKFHGFPVSIYFLLVSSSACNRVWLLPLQGIFSPTKTENQSFVVST